MDKKEIRTYGDLAEKITNSLQIISTFAHFGEFEAVDEEKNICKLYF